MSMGDIVPTVPLGGNNGFFGGDGLAAFAGGALGAWFGNGMMNGGWGNGGWNRGGGCGCNGGGMTGPIVINADDGHGHCSTAELDALSGIQSSINGLGLQLLQGQNASNLADCQGFSGVVNATNQGFSGLNNVVTTGNAAIQQSLCQGFGGLNTAILGASKDIALQDCQSTGAIVKAISDCCCNTQRAIAEQGQLTRDLINQNTITGLQTALCDAKSKIGSLESQAVLAASQAAQTAQVQHAIDRQSLQFGAVLSAYRTGRIDERDSAAATPAA
jgi:hypothetical protein